MKTKESNSHLNNDIKDCQCDVPARGDPPESYEKVPPEMFQLMQEEEVWYNSSKKTHERCCCCSCKYSRALKTLLPCRPSKKDGKLPSNVVGLLSFFSVTWLNSLMWKAWRKGLSNSDVWDLHEEDCCRINTEKLERLWSEEQLRAKKEQSRDASFSSVTWKYLKTRILVCITMSFFLNCITFLGPSVFVKLTLDYVDDPKIDHIFGLYLVLALLLISMIRASLFNSLMIVSTHTAIRLVSGLQGLIYKKMLRFKNGGDKIAAQITNVTSNDTERLLEACVSVAFITVTPVIFTLNVGYGIYVIGPWCLLGFLVYFLFFPIMGAIGKGQSLTRARSVKKTDQRVSLMNEILNSIKLIKMYSWEDSFEKKVAEIRHLEMKKHQIASLLQAVSSTVIPSVSILATICTVLGYTLSGNDLSSAAAFTMFSIFNSMHYLIGALPFTIRALAESKISIQRIQKVLELPEHRKDGPTLFNNTLALEIKNASFSWEIYALDLKHRPAATKKDTKGDKKDASAETNGRLPTEEAEDEPKNPPKGAAVSLSSVETLFGINLSVAKGKLLGICGSIGSGKSSLISAICGDMDKKSGELKVDGRLGLVSQQAWIYNASLRENILMGREFDEEWFEEVVGACSLKSDLAILPNRDLTEIGERGINLSGGQKQRVNLARAVYAKRDIYLLDDPLSSVDSKVANQIFRNCIKGVLKGKTVLLISHGSHFLEKCEEIIFMKNGRISERGTHESLSDRQGEYYNLMAHDSNLKRSDSVVEPSSEYQEQKSVDEDKDAGKLIIDEAKEIGSVSAGVYLKFIKVSGGWFIASLIFLAIVLFTLVRLFNILWLQIWLDTGDGLESFRLENRTLYNISYTDDELKGNITDNEKLWMFQLVYGLTFVFLITTGFIKGIGVTFRILAGSTKLHHDMFHSILHSPMKFLDTTPPGRILNRFSRDMDEVDVRIPFFVEFVLQGLLGISLQILLVCYLFPIFIPPLLVISVLFVLVDVVMNDGVRELKRIDNTLRSPVVQQITSTLAGLSIIRTFDREESFSDKLFHFTDKHSSANLVSHLSKRWYTFRMDVLASCVTFTITAICIFTKGHFSVASAGLALATLSGVCGFLPHFMRLKAEFTSRVTSVERIMEYAYQIESEAPQHIEANKPSSTWPCEGAVEFNDIKLRYRPELPLVLHGISAAIKPSEKIGIVGRTGAGKSSLITTLLRLVELDSGSVLIDGVDISKIGLHDLRSAISVIPQDPVLFQGTLRYNLDPFEVHADDAIWTALELSHLKGVVMELNYKLNSEVVPGGENFSLGEKQLICLARALLRQSKILLLDEATASVDVETDHLIQKTIQEAFRDCTVITIAHRLNTIISYDRVMVLDNGKVKEFDTPDVLMEIDGSMFREMMKATGIHSTQEMKALALSRGE